MVEGVGVCVVPHWGVKSLKVPFGEWLPDQPILSNPGATVAKNVLPYAQAYGQLKDLSSFTNALTSATNCLGMVWARDNTGTYYNHAGTATRLESLDSNSEWQNVSIAGNYTNAVNWEWTQVGNRLIATDLFQAVQYFDLGTSTLYANLAGTPPKARHIAAVRNFVVLGNLDIGGTTYPERLAWSGYNNTEQWTASRATQSDLRDLRGRWGVVQRIVPGQYGVVFQTSAVSIMSYSGPPAIFTIDTVEKGRGTPAPNSVCWTGDAVYYLGPDGFYRFTDRSYPIGAEKVDRWFFNECDLSSLDEVRGVADLRNKLIVWTFRTDPSLTYNNRIIFYNWAADKWSYGELDTTAFGEYVTSGLTLDQLDTVLADIDSESIPVDSDAYQGGFVSLTAFNTSHQLCTFQGSAKQAVLETVEVGENQRMIGANVRPLVSGTPTTVSLQHGYRNAQDANVTFGLQKSVNDAGVVNFRNSGRYSRFRMNVSGGFENAIGVDVEPIPGGLR